MKSLFAVQIGLLIVVGVMLGGVLVSSGVYSDVQNNIVKVLCLSCIKLDPKTSSNFTFETANGQPHPKTFRDELVNGPIMIMYSEDVCDYCEQMYPVVQHMMNVSFDKDDSIHVHRMMNGTNVTFYFINIDHTTPALRATEDIYDKDHVGGLPMFTFITLRYDQGTVRPYYTSVYGILGLSTPEQREAALVNILNDSIHLYHDSIIGYEP